MLVLAMDTATDCTSVAVRDDAGVLASAVERDGRRHAEVLAPMIRAALAAAGAPPGDLTHIACGVGPGPYTGLRVGLATAASMGLALGIPVVGVCTLDVIAAASASAGPFAVVTDAKRREVYWAAYDDPSTRVRGPLVMRPADAAAAISDLHAVGRGALMHREVFLDVHDPPDLLDPSDVLDPDARVLAAIVMADLARGLRVADAGPAPLDDPSGHGIESGVVGRLVAPRPLYLRRPDATPPAGTP